LLAIVSTGKENGDRDRDRETEDNLGATRGIDDPLINADKGKKEKMKERRKQKRKGKESMRVLYTLLTHSKSNQAINQPVKPHKSEGRTTQRNDQKRQNGKNKDELTGNS